MITNALNAINLLKRLEWSVQSERGPRCPICSNTQKYGHTLSCELAAALKQPDENSIEMAEAHEAGMV